MKFLFIGLIFFSFANPASASFLKAEELNTGIHLCGENMTFGDISGHSWHCILAAGYLVGLLDTLEQQGTLPKCFPSGRVTKAQLMTVVKNYLAKHPELFHLPASKVAKMAIDEAWSTPCSD